MRLKIPNQEPDRLYTMPLGVSNCQFHEAPTSISFSGSGFMATYQLGVAQCFQTYAPWILHNAPSVLGASAGSLVAAAVVCEINLISIRDEMLHFAKQVKTFRLGPLNPSINVFRWLERILQKYVPPEAHKLACGRLAVAVTRLEDGKHIVITEYQSRDDVVQALLCSCFVPGYCGMTAPSFKGEYYVDGGFTGMQPVQSQSPTLTVSPFSGDIDICPTDSPCMWDMVVSGTTLRANGANCLRVVNALYPRTLETLEEAFDSGYKDAIHFLLRNDLAPYLILHEIPHTKPHLEPIKGEDEEMKKRDSEASLALFTDDRKSHKEEDPIQKQTIMHLDFIENVLLSYLMTNENLLGMPVKVFSYLLLPLLLTFFIVLQSWHRLRLWFWESPQWIIWTWAGLGHFIGFFYDICICTIKKNINDRVKHITLLFQWLSIQAEFNGAPQKRKLFSPSANTSVFSKTNVLPKSSKQLSTEYKKLD